MENEDETSHLSDETLMEMLSEEFASIQATERELDAVLQQRNRYRYAAIEQLGRLPVKDVENLMSTTRRVIESLPALELEVCELRKRTAELRQQLDGPAVSMRLDYLQQHCDSIVCAAERDKTLLRKAENYLHAVKQQRQAKSLVLTYFFRKWTSV